MGIQAIGIQKAFGGVRALAGVSLALEPKEIVGLVGPNRSGKTTLLNVISGIYSPEAGSVTLDGTEITGMAPNKVAREPATASPPVKLGFRPNYMTKISTRSVPRAGKTSSPFPPS